jgi:hypothetical protein
LAHFAPRIQHDDEETVTRPLIRPQPYLLRAPIRTKLSLELEEPTEPQRQLPDTSCDEEWLTTNELRRPPLRAERPLQLVKRRQPSGALPPLRAPGRAPSPSRPALPPVPAFTRPIAVALPRPPAPMRRECAAEIELREDLRVDWAQMEALPTTARGLAVPHVFRPKLPTMRGLELGAMLQSPLEIHYAPLPEQPSVVIHPRAERRSELPPAQSNPISEIPPCAFAAPAPEPPRGRGLSELVRALRTDAWTAFLVLPLAVSLICLVVLGVMAIGSSSESGAGDPNRRVVSATDSSGNMITDATVFVDGAAKCASLPCAFELERGTHWVSVSAAGYDAPPARAVVADYDGPRQIEFVLSAREPERAPVFAARAEESPPVAAPAAALSIEQPAPSPAIERVPPAPARKRTAAARAVVEPNAGRSGTALLNINSIPASNVVLDGRPLGRTPRIGVRVAPGPHTVVFIDGKRRVVRGTNVSAGKTAVVAARF